MTCCPTVSAALETFRERHLQHADADPESELYRCGLADAYADAESLLRVLAVPGWPAQFEGDPDDLADRAVPVPREPEPAVTDGHEQSPTRRTR